MNKLILEEFIENSMLRYSQSPIQNTVAKFVEHDGTDDIGNKIDESITSSGNAAPYYKKLLRDILSRVAVESVLPHISSVIPMKTPKGGVPMITSKYVGTDNPGTDNIIILEVEDVSSFTVGGDISDSGTGEGEVLYLETDATPTFANYGRILVKVTAGTFVVGDVDNVIPFVAPETQIIGTFSNVAGVGSILKEYSGPYNTSAGEALLANTTQDIAIVLSLQELEAKTRKLKTGITIEALKDLNQYGKYTMEKVKQVLANIIDQAITTEYFTLAKSIATPQPDIDLTASSGSTAGIKQIYQDIYSRVNMSIGRIGTNTKLSGEYFVVASSKVAAALETAVNIKAPKKFTADNKKWHGIMPNGALLVEDPYAPADYLLVGCAGPDGFDNGGIIYSPYLIDFIIAKDDKTLQDILGVMVRFDLKRSQLDTKTNLGESDFFELSYVTGFSSLNNGL